MKLIVDEKYIAEVVANDLMNRGFKGPKGIEVTFGLLNGALVASAITESSDKHEELQELGYASDSNEDDYDNDDDQSDDTDTGEGEQATEKKAKPKRRTRRSKEQIAKDEAAKAKAEAPTKVEDKPAEEKAKPAPEAKEPVAEQASEGEGDDLPWDDGEENNGDDDGSVFDDIDKTSAKPEPSKGADAPVEDEDDIFGQADVKPKPVVETSEAGLAKPAVQDEDDDIFGSFD